jgi:hypothetical protein
MPPQWQRTAGEGVGLSGSKPRRGRLVRHVMNSSINPSLSRYLLAKLACCAHFKMKRVRREDGWDVSHERDHLRDMAFSSPCLHASS